MCGIIGYVGEKEAAPILLAGLKRLAYRGYDSAGVAVLGLAINVKKDVGKIDEIHSKSNLLDLPGQTGIAHTRWATHGGVTQANAHPHLSCDSGIAVVHNGIIENYQELRGFLIKGGHVFKSQTDTEIISHLIEEFYSKKGDTLKSVLEGIALLKGSFAFLVIFRGHPNLIIGVRKDAPLIVGVKGKEYFVASDVLAFIECRVKTK